MNKVKIRLHTLSPLHIGCGEEYDPTTFFIDEDENRPSLVMFNEFDLFNLLDDQEKKEFRKICLTKDIFSILHFIDKLKNRFKIKNKVPLSIDLAYEFFEFLDKKEKRKGFSKFQIDRVSYLKNNNRPFVPGSSLKGCFRTAIVDNQIQKKQLKKTYDKAKWLEKDALGGEFLTDPMTHVKVGDLMPVKEKVFIGYAHNRSKKDVNISKVNPQPIEYVREDATFEGEILFKPGKIELPFLIRSLKNYFLPFLKKDLSMGFWNIDSFSRFNSIPKEKKAFVKLGRFGGAVSKTLNGYRKIAIRVNGKVVKSNATDTTTYWLASDKKEQSKDEKLDPFGWCLLEVID
jgi:CRISPR-associated protein Csm5